jgi:hypothetical protein
MNRPFFAVSVRLSARRATGKSKVCQPLDPAFRLEEFAETRPYRNPQDLERLLGRLRDAGLPN